MSTINKYNPYQEANGLPESRKTHSTLSPNYPRLMPDTADRDSDPTCSSLRSAYNVLTWELKSLSVTYQYFNGSYSLLDSTPSTLEQGQHISDGSWAGLEYVHNAIDGTGLFSGSYAKAVAERLSLVTLVLYPCIIGPAGPVWQFPRRVFTL
ncbi:hypothetical protein DFH07DRAFT_963627 [Mycena maculata]|uniref:Uncharacterized protein n=1 Tax=Mycena maculata TaxID=230809 RepID=A0AAD7IJU0_9AGAR|nr:hypothetical protein DFH07DRAFT_963627 [Mycena maculata]